ncbi:uncharacterized protein AC631_00314 [Debaryomyces fabryi]|uniref:GPI transamidase component GPI17 n=1 Tax=Debaryomyces fabryi TaxID=58627 RepID=A0A0V1Q5W3_9ASCO|nr:uncharacterized protein AC631_00314 [Debaryomyces fabryi]KSA03859.1 hypothetical protein AC631_00314 [Debaryomyces fabryi]CUM48680.1 unnamed protein product [Debaryomyces fabryi]
MTEKDTENKNREELSSITVVRRVIVFVILLIIVFLGIPLWKSTTTIHRAELPIVQVKEHSISLQDQIHYKIPVYLDIPNSLVCFIPQAQELLDKKIYNEYPELKDFWAIELRKIDDNIDAQDDYIVKFEYLPSPNNEEEQDPTESFFISPFSKETRITITDNVVRPKKVDEFLSIVLTEYIFKGEIEQMSDIVRGKNHDSRNLVMPYSSKYNIVISLLSENGRPINWEIEKALGSFELIFFKLNHFANFTVTSQIQYYSTLTYPPNYDESKQAFIIPESGLSTFVNFGDWNLITHDINPSINFILYFPEANYNSKPTLIENSKTNSFLIPQWGGVVIFNKDMKTEGSDINENELLPVMETFASQLFQLLGMPSQPRSPSIKIDSLSRTMTHKNLKQSLENLEALLTLTNSLNEISIPELTKIYVEKSIHYLEESINELNNGNFYLSMKYSSQSLENSDRAFFEKEMVQQAYFPSEHKLAVFLPLLGPLCSIVSIGALKVIKDIKANRNNKVKKE